MNLTHTNRAIRNTTRRSSIFAAEVQIRRQFFLEVFIDKAMVFKRYVEQPFDVDGLQRKVQAYPRKIGVSQLKNLGTFQILKKIPPFYMNYSMEVCCYPQSLFWLRLVTCVPKGFANE